MVTLCGPGVGCDINLTSKKTQGKLYGNVGNVGVCLETVNFLMKLLGVIIPGC